MSAAVAVKAEEKKSDTERARPGPEFPVFGEGFGAVAGMPAFLSSTGVATIQRQEDEHGGMQHPEPVVVEDAAGSGLEQPPEDNSGGTLEALEPRPIQAKLVVGAAQDVFEREADDVADLVTRQPVMASHATSVHMPVAGAWGIQRLCKECEGEEKEEDEKPLSGLRVQRLCEECAEKEERDGEEGRIQRKPVGTGAADGSDIDAALLDIGSGSPLSPHVRARLEPALGTDLGEVRVHTDAAARSAADALHAKAFTHKNHIWLGRGQNPGDVRLMAHELTHVIQQGAAQSSTLGRATSATPSVQRFSLPGAESLSDARSAVRGAIGRGVEWTLRRVSPELVTLVRKGPFQFVKERVEGLIASWAPSVFGAIPLSVVAQNVSSSLGGAVDEFEGVMRADPRSCRGFADMLAGMRGLAQRLIDSPAIRSLRAGLERLNSAVTTVGRVILAPAFEDLEMVLGPGWRVMRRVATTVWGWIRRVRELAGAIWDWVAEQLGFGGDEASEDGVWAWVKRKAAVVWGSIKGALAPMAGPMGTVLKVLAALTPMGQVYLLVSYGPKVVQTVQWLWDHRNDPDIIRTAHREMGNTVLPQLLEAVPGFRNRLRSAADWLLEHLTSLSEGLLSFLGGVTGVPLLSRTRRLVGQFTDAIRRVTAWAHDALHRAVATMQSVAQRIVAFVEPAKEVLLSIGMAITNPAAIPSIITGWAWRRLPDNCIKVAIIDFVLDMVISALEAIPDLVFFGPLWPLLKSGVLGFLRRLNGMSAAVKEAVSNKVSRIMNGTSPSFVFGFVKGFLLGLWDGIADPFRAIWMVVQGLSKVTEFFESLAVQALQTAAVGAARPTATVAAPVPALAGAGPSGRPPQMAAPANMSEGPARAVLAPAPTLRLDPRSRVDLGTRVGQMARELEPDVTTVSGGFWDAAREYFSSGHGMTFDQLMTKLGAAWAALRAKIQEAGGTLADRVMQYLIRDEAEGDLGEKVGWLSGTIVFQVVLDLLTSGAWAVAYPTLALIARFINWPMEVLGEAFKLLGRVGRYLLEGLQRIGRVVREAAGGALRMVTQALERIGQKLLVFAEEILGRFVGVAERGVGTLVEREASTIAEREAAALAEREVAKAAGGRTLKEAERRALGDAEAKAARDVETKAAQEAEEKEIAQVEERSAREAAEKPEAIAAARSIAMVNDRLRVPMPLTMVALTALRRRFSWIKDFEAERKPLIGHYRLVMIASRSVIDEDYDDEDVLDPLRRKERLPEGTHTAGDRPKTDLRRLRERSPSEALGDSLEEAGFPRPEGAHAHHGAPTKEGGEEMQWLADKLEDLGIKRDMAENGAWLVGTQKTPNLAGGVPHLSYLHAGRRADYLYTLSQRLKDLEGPAFAREFQTIMDEIREGSFKFMEAPRGWKP